MAELTQILTGHGGIVLFAIVLVEQAGLPLPSAPWLLAAGALSATGHFNPILAIGITALACVIADTGWFFAGRLGGQRVLRLFCRWSLAPCACVGRTKGVFERYGLQGLIAGKFLPGLGAVMPPLAGALGVKTSRFLLFDGLGSLIYGGSYITAGLLFHNQLAQVLALLNQLGFSLLLLVLGVVSAYAAFKYFRRVSAARRSHHNQAGSPEPAFSGATIMLGHGVQPAIQAAISGESGSMRFENVAEAFTSPGAEPIGVSVSSTQNI